MEWLSKIPPMMSALAFGYGVGMAAPDAAIDDVRGALSRPPGAVAPGAALPPGAPPGWGPGWGPYPPPPHLYGYYGYPPPQPGALQRPGPLDGAAESNELARLRQSGDGASCKIPAPAYSQAPVARDASGDDADGFDPGELDPAGQEALSRLQLPDFPVAITKSAIKYVRFLTRTHRGRDLFEAWLKRSGRFTEMIQQNLRERHLPEDLIWVAMIESGFDPAIKSPAGAMGLWQFMRSTGEVYGLEVNRFHDERKNPVKATRAAAHHLRDLYQRFGSWDLAFAAYNMGYEQLLERIDRYGTSDFAELARMRALPSETAAYVPKIVAAALVANNLERYGFADVKVYKPFHYAELSVPGGTPLSTIAKAAGITTSALQKHNPHISTKYVPPGLDYVVMIPPETLSRARAALPAMLDRKLASNDADVLLPADLRGLSGGESSKHLRHEMWSGDENLLGLLPKPKRRSMRNLVGSAPSPEPAESADDAVAAEFAPRRADRETVMYRVGSGDSLLAIAKQFAVDVEDLARDNGIEPDGMLREGALLKILVKPEVLEGWKKGKQAKTTRRASRKRG